MGRLVVLAFSSWDHFSSQLGMFLKLYFRITFDQYNNNPNLKDYEIV